MQGEAATFAKLGHVVCRTSGDLPFTFCARCGGWAARRCHRLSSKCEPPTAAGKLALKRIADGQHPWRKKRKGGGEEERTAVHVEAAYDGSQGAWKRRRFDHANGAPAARPANTDGEADPSTIDDTHGDKDTVELMEADRNTIACSPLGAAAAEAQPRRDSRLEGTSMRMIISVLRSTSGSAQLDSSAAIFNGTTGCVVTTAVGAIEAERDWLRKAGVRDDDEGTCAHGAKRSPGGAGDGPHGQEGKPGQREAPFARNVAARLNPAEGQLMHCEPPLPQSSGEPSAAPKEVSREDDRGRSRGAELLRVPPQTLRRSRMPQARTSSSSCQTSCMP